MSEDGRLNTLDGRLDKLVEVTTKLSGLVAKVEQQISGLSEQMKERLEHHETETDKQIAANSERISKLEYSVNDLQDAPGEKAKERWELVVKIGSRIIAAILAAAAIYYLGV